MSSDSGKDFENTSSASCAVQSPHALTVEEALTACTSSVHGLARSEVAIRLDQYGQNSLPETRPPAIARVFTQQFLSPLIYVLVIATVVSVIIQQWSDAVFITAVLLINGIIGTFQEYSAQQAASALRHLVATRCRVLREGSSFEIDARQLVPGDIVLLESGDRVPADIRLIATHDLEADESLLTGESTAILKQADTVIDSDAMLADRNNMVHAGTLINRGRGHGVVTATSLATELGQISEAVLARPAAKAPLLIRMEKFTHRVAIIVAIAIIFMAGIAMFRGTNLQEIFLLAVALAVSAIPEGLPVALTVALAIGMRRMAHRNVIVRRLVAVESLGSCTFIATDKTGTLTVNQLTIRYIRSPLSEPWEVTGSGIEPDGNIITSTGSPTAREESQLARLCQAAVLCNDGFLGRHDNEWTCHGDAVDVAMLVLAHKAGISREETLNTCPEIATIPFESERLFSASLNSCDDQQHVSVKGAVEKLLPMCTRMADQDQDIAIDAAMIESQAREMAANGYRVIALAAGNIVLNEGEVFSEEHLEGLTFLGLAGMIDPLRAEAHSSLAHCQQAGIKVAMITGDHPVTALAIARELGLAENSSHIVTGQQLKQASKENRLDDVIMKARVFARVEPQQKLDIVHSLQQNGHFVAVSGDGANDAPALRAAHVGVAMGKGGTDVARESADIIIADDNFASIVAGIEEGRIAYANVRKVIFLLVSTGMAELVLFTLSLLTGQPLPLLAVQLLWLNLVTNGIQDVALAFEPAEGRELQRPPRSPQDPIFNRLMIERVVISALVIGSVAFLVFQWLLARGYTVDAARNGTLLLMVLFENIHVFNSRSESRSVFRHNPLRNPILLIGTGAAQLIHIGAMYTPWIKDVLHIQPVSPAHWLELLLLALSVLLAMELHKAWRRTLARKTHTRQAGH